MRNLVLYRPSLFVVFFLLILSGCGGGDGDDGVNSLQLSTNSASFSLGAGTGNSSRTVVVNLPANTQSLVAGYTTSQTKPSWVSYSFDPVNIVDTTANFKIGVNATGLTLGTYTDRITIEARDLGGSLLAHGTVTVTFTVTDPLSINLSRLDFQTANGASNVPVKSISLSRVSTSGNWSASADQAWVTLSATNGSTPSILDVGANLAGLTIGKYTATLSITDNNTAQTTDIPVTLNIEPHRLSIIDNGVALSSLPSRSRLSHTIEIGENGGTSTTWSAASDQTWLTLSTSTGSTGGTLALIADPTGLTVDTIHYANVTISSADVTIVNSEIVRVGFYISSVDASATMTFAGLSQADYPSGLVADPIRPYVYVSNMESDILVYNVYSGALVTTISGNINDTFSDLEVSSDGSYLYAVNRFDNSINQVDLSTLTMGSTWTGFNFPVYASTPYLSQMDIRYARLNGYPVLVTSGSQVLDAADGSVLTNMNDLSIYFRPPMIALSPNGETAFASYANYPYFDLDRYELWYSYVSNTATAFLAQTKPRNTWENAPVDMTMNQAGTRLLTVQPYSIDNHFRSYSNDENMDATLHEAYGSSTVIVAITRGPTGKIYTVKRASGIDDTVYIYDDSYSLLTSTPVTAWTVNRKLVTSGDGMRLILRSRNAGDDGIVMTDVTP